MTAPLAQQARERIGRFGADGFVSPALRLIVVASVLLGAGVLCSLMIGSASFTLGETLSTLFGIGPQDRLCDKVIWGLRAPRVAVGVLVGASLAVAGVLLQGALRNPLASPEITGVTAGAGLGATIVIVAAPAWLTAGAFGAMAIPAAAFAGCVCAACFVYCASRSPNGEVSVLRMTLAGVAVMLTLGAAQLFLMVWFSDLAEAVLLWMAGSLNRSVWSYVWVVAPCFVVGYAAAAALSSRLDIMQFDAHTARSLGVPVGATRNAALLTACMLVAASVSVVGMLGFLGLIMPHMVRLLGCTKHRSLIPAAAICGAAALVWLDFGARVAGEKPVGAILGMIGGPYFLFLLRRSALL